MALVLSVVVHDFDIFGAAGRPAEAHPELIVDPDAVLPGAVTLEGLWRAGPVPLKIRFWPGTLFRR
jgi:hypothetical protein